MTVFDRFKKLLPARAPTTAPDAGMSLAAPDDLLDTLIQDAGGSVQPAAGDVSELPPVAAQAELGAAVAMAGFEDKSASHHRRNLSVLLGLALVQGVLIVSAFNVRRVRRTVLAPA